MDKKSITKKLHAIEKKRGYLLAHHGLLAASGDELLDAYDALYSAINFTKRTLSRHDHEFVWLAILIVCREPLATHHLSRYFEAGGDDTGLAAIVSLATFAQNAETYRFVADHWSAHRPEFDISSRYLEGFRSAAGDTEAKLAQLAALAIHVCTGNSDALRWHLTAASDLGVDDNAIAESLSLAMVPGSVPNYASAAETWRRMIEKGEVQASPAFTAWASISGQGGFDEASLD